MKIHKKKFPINFRKFYFVIPLYSNHSIKLQKSFPHQTVLIDDIIAK